VFHSKIASRRLPRQSICKLSGRKRNQSFLSTSNPVSRPLGNLNQHRFPGLVDEPDPPTCSISSAETEFRHPLCVPRLNVPQLRGEPVNFLTNRVAVEKSFVFAFLGNGFILEYLRDSLVFLPVLLEWDVAAGFLCCPVRQIAFSVGLGAIELRTDVIRIQDDRLQLVLDQRRVVGEGDLSVNSKRQQLATICKLPEQDSNLHQTS